MMYHLHYLLLLYFLKRDLTLMAEKKVKKEYFDTFFKISQKESLFFKSNVAGLTSPVACPYEGLRKHLLYVRY